MSSTRVLANLRALEEQGEAVGLGEWEGNIS
jgi:hypothetical protein